MGTLSSCLKKIGLSKHEAAILRGATDDNIKDGDEAHVAAVRAVADYIEQLDKERAAIVAQIDKAGGVAPDAPFKLADLAELTSVLRKNADAAPSAKSNIASPDVRWKAAGAVATHFIREHGFDTITQARAFVAEQLGIGKIDAGTEAAKYADEIIENGVVKAARHIVQKGTLRGASKEEIYERLVQLYEQQPTLGVRTSTSVREQAYSTPAPLAYVAARLANIKPGTPVYEPTAGNGMLLINSLADSIVANELNGDRFAMLKQSLPGAKLIQGDATKNDMARGAVRAVIANPPFGVVKDGDGNTVTFKTEVGYDTNEIDHAIVFKALDAIPDNGTATLIVGGVMAKGEDGRKDGYRAKAKREFYFNLYNNYQVAQHFTVSGDLYAKQGASYPVDVIVINGRGKSTRALPAADLPKVYNSWEELKEVLNDENRAVATGNEPSVRADNGADQAGQGDTRTVAGRPGGSGAVNDPVGGRSGAADAAGGQGNVAPTAGAEGGRAASGQAQSGAADGVQSERPGKVAGSGKEQRAGTGVSERPGKLDSGNGSRDALKDNDRRGQEVETDRQVTYEPRSASSAVGTLVPVNMRDAVQNSLNRLEDEVGDLDEFVASRIGMDVESMQRNFSAEQVDALAMAINNAEHGGGFIIGDQTGIGKGRIVAGMIRYAINRGLMPVFVTEKPNLYADMMRDLSDIGMGEMLGYGTDDLRVLMTNKDESVPYGANGEYAMPKLGRQADAVWQEMIANEQAPSKYLAIFTTYSQMQTSGGAMPDRMKAIQAIMPNAYLILDESHNAGGTGAAGGRKTAKQLIAERTNGFVGRSGFMRLLVQKAKASFFSSATYAKRPNVMDLYQSTNMIHAVDKPEQLGDAIARGGVPLQQITAAMLAADGQYMRRERSFHGVKYDTKPVGVDKDAAENMAHAMSEVLNFSRMKDGAIGKLQDEYDAAGAMLTDVGNNAKTSVEGANFGSIMHNLIDQMLLALKTKGAVDEAMAALERGEKVVLTVANTMGSFIADYAKEMELSAGQPVNLSFTDLYRKYLEKQRWVRIKSPNGETSLYRLTDDDLGPVISSMFRRIDDWMKQANFGDAPISPIDYLHAELRKRKVNGKSIATDEITGRTATINYEGVTPVLASRSSSIKTRLKAINGFNNGDIDVLILNQSGSTGLSLHASEKFKDQRPRHMILIQAEKNIDTHMQMLGRIHRTGQVKLPIYSQLMADIPAELRPAAVLQGKMAKLTANTTASKDSDFAADGVVDFMNDYGGQVAVEYLLDNPEVYHKLGGADMMTLSQDEASEDDIRKLTGYIPLLPIKMQEKVYGELVARYKELIQRETELGTNKLEARAIDLDAETLASEVADPGKPENKSLFSAPVVMERVSVKRTSKPLTREQVEKVVSNRLGGVPAHAISRDMQNDLREKTGEYIKKVVAERTERGDEEAKIEAAVDVIRGMLAIANDKISSYRIGTSHQINLDGQIFYGIVTDVKHHDRAANPAAQSAWTVQFALAMADANSVTIPFSQLGDKFKTELTSGTMWGDLASGGNRWVSINELFDLAQTSGREKRWMVTGNLLSGYAKFPGQLVHYTKQDGSQAQGILMSRAYDYGKTKEMLGARFNKVERILEFFSQAPSRSVITDQDGAMRIEQDRPGSFVIQVPKSKRQGGHYFLDTQLTDIIGKDFVTVGAQMRATVQGIDQIGNVLRHVLGEQADYFTAMTNKDVASRINDAANQKLGGDTPATLSASLGRNDRNAAVVVDAVAANDAIAAAMSGLEGAPSVTLAESFSDLPPEIQAEAKDQDAGEANFNGAYKRGHIWILRANHATVEDIEATLFHELYGHHGTRVLFGNKWMQEINKLYTSIGGWPGLKAIAAKRGINLESYRKGVLNWDGDKKIWRDPVMMEELLAHMAEQQPNQKLRDRIKDGIKRLVGMFRQWLRDKGFAQLAQRGETDLLHILAQASQAVREGKSVKSGPAFSVLSRGDDAPTMMRRSVAETLADKLQASSPKIADALRDTFATNEKFGWWHKTLGTQHHKAHLDKDFAKVYHAAQAFERDTARMASDAADLAPDLLPKMDGIGGTLRTAKNVKRDAQDSAAISPWVYYGTLAESVFTDEQLRNPDAVIAKFGQLLPESQPLKPLTERQIKLYRQYHSAINKSLEDLAISEMGRLARMAKLDMAEPTMTMHEAARFYFEQIAGEIQRLSGALEELKEEQKAEAKLLEDAAEDEATGADQRKRYAKLLMDMKAKHKEQREAITEPLADLLNMKEHFIGRAMKIKELQDKGYAPLMRFGKYTVDVTLQDENGKVLTDADGNELRPFFGMFESEAEANAVARELREEYPDHTVTQGILSEHQHQLFQGITPENVELYAKAVGMDTDEAFQRYLKLATANRSAMKRLIHRKGTAGFSFDATRSLASFITSNSRAASSNLHIGDMLKAVADIDKTKGDVKDEAIKLMEYVRSPAEGGVAIRSLLFFQYLGGSVASALVNMTQTFTTTFPYLSQEKFGGPKKAADELRKAMAMSAKRMRGGSTGDKALDALLKRAEEEGVVAPHEIHMLQGEAGRGSGMFANSPLWRSLENKYPALRFTSRFIDAGKSLWGSFFSLAEQYNRQVAFIAAYQMAKQQGKSEAQAYAMAEQAVEESQFNYQKSARPNWARSAVGATLLTFKTFLINYLEFLKRLPNRERAIAVGMLVLLAGAQGAPGADDLDDIIDTIGQAAGYSTNSKRWKREVLGDIFGNSDFGKAASGFILHGVSEFLPLDVSGRLSVGNIIPATSLLKRDNTSATDEIAELIGPAGGLAKKMHEGVKGIVSGDDAGHALVSVLAPKAINDIYKGYDMVRTGVYRDFRGRKVTDASTFDAAIKAIGFQPNSVAVVKRAERLVQQDIALFRNVKQDIAERWARGIFERDTDKVAKAREELRDWNEKNPAMPMAVKAGQIQRRVTEMRKTSGDRVIAASPKEVRGNVGSVLRAGELQ